MIEIEFNYNQMVTKIKAKIDEPFQDAINKYIQKSLIQPDSANYLVNGKIINPNESVESYMSKLDKENKRMKILVTMIEKDEPNKQQVIIKSKEIICPQCKEPCRINKNK